MKYVLQHVKAFETSDAGVERVVEELVAGLNAAGGSRCDVLCQGAVTEKINHGRHEVLRCATTFTVSSAALSWDDYWTWRQRRTKYDVVHVHAPWPQSNVNALFAPVKGALIVHWHSDIVDKPLFYAAFKPFETWLLQRADRICVTSPKLLEESSVLAPYQSKCVAIPNGVRDVTGRANEATTARVATLANGRKLVFALGRLVPYKGFEYLIEAAAALPEDYLIVIGGSGPLRRNLQSAIDRDSLGDKVRLVGHLSNDEAQAWMEACECFCLPSVLRSEAFGLVQLEAMRAGKPVISTRLHGSGVDWVNQHLVSGLVVPPRNASELATAIQTLGGDDALRARLGAGARQRYETFFTAEKMVRATAEVYRSLL